MASRLSIFKYKATAWISLASLAYALSSIVYFSAAIWSNAQWGNDKSSAQLNLAISFFFAILLGFFTPMMFFYGYLSKAEEDTEDDDDGDEDEGDDDGDEANDEMVLSPTP